MTAGIQLTAIGLFLVLGLVMLVLSSMLEPPKAKLWVAVLCIYIIELLRLLPVGR